VTNEKTCPKCGTLNHLDAKFCRECGAKLGETQEMDISDKWKISMLKRKLTSMNPKVRQEAAKALAEIRKPAIDPFIKALKNDNERVRRAAATALDKIRSRGVG